MESWVQLLHTLRYTWVEPVYQCLIVYDIEIIKRDGQYWHLIRCRSEERSESHGPFGSVKAAVENALEVMEAHYQRWEAEFAVA